MLLTTPGPEPRLASTIITLDVDSRSVTGNAIVSPAFSRVELPFGCGIKEYANSGAVPLRFRVNVPLVVAGPTVCAKLKTIFAVWALLVVGEYCTPIPVLLVFRSSVTGQFDTPDTTKSVEPLKVMLFRLAEALAAVLV